ncbi:MAG: GNAT family N-acetyltransferase [Ardenticatenales bacterium]|nr:GNAT family N-acetyltransferase [Ardenticatenales bacterium]
MTVRSIKLPDDFPIITEIIPKAFVYPENPEWNTAAEVTSFRETMQNLQRFWLPLSLLLRISPRLADIFRGYIWEEEGQPVGLIVYQRQGSTDTWYISTVAVLPSFRRRGIAHHLVTTALDAIRQAGGEMTLLKVITGNQPAYTLYEQMGFRHFTSDLVLCYDQAAPPPEIPLPDGYTLEAGDLFNWSLSYDLMQRITPAEVQRYVPVRAEQFQYPKAIRLFTPLVERISGTKQHKFVVRSSAGEVVAITDYSVRRRSGGMNQLDPNLDPCHASLAPSLIQHSLREMQHLAPNRETQVVVPQWQQSLLEAVYAAGGVAQKEYQWMAMNLHRNPLTQPQ